MTANETAEAIGTVIRAFREENAALNRRAAELRAENRGDEAVFCTVRANVYDICATVCNVHLGRGNLPAAAEILARFEGEWGAALEQARQRGDARKVCVEEAKLEALADVRARLAEAGCA